MTCSKSVIFTEIYYFRTIEPREGRVSVFTSGVENKHFVTPVTSGTRYALTMGFTCDPKYSHKVYSFKKISNSK